MLEDQGSSRTVIRGLATYVRSQRLDVGDRLPSVRQLAEMFDVSRNVARDALVQAEAMGLLEIQPRSGAYLRSPDGLCELATPESYPVATPLATGLHDHQFYLLQARELVEVELAGRAAARRQFEDLPPIRNALAQHGAALEADQLPQAATADTAFHLAIARIAGNPVLTQTLEDYLRRLPIGEFSVLPNAAAKRASHQLHVDLYTALVAGDPAAAQSAMREHMQAAYRSLSELLRTTPTVDFEASDSAMVVEATS